MSVERSDWPLTWQALCRLVFPARAWEPHKAHTDTSSPGRTCGGLGNLQTQYSAIRGPGDCISGIKEGVTGSTPNDGWRLHRQRVGKDTPVDGNWLGKEPKSGHGGSQVEGVHRRGLGDRRGRSGPSCRVPWSGGRAAGHDRCGSPCQAPGWEGRA